MTTIVEDELHGRGAWTTYGKANGSLYYAYLPPNPRDGDNPTDMPDMWVDRVRRGVAGLQRLLAEQGSTVEVSGRFGKATHDAVIAFQQRANLNSEGYVGAHTMEALLRPVMLSVAVEVKVHPRWLYGFCHQESGFDPGAQGWENTPDSGLAQFNVANGSVTLDEAYRPRRALTLLAQRWSQSLVKYEHENRRLTLDCAIAQHRSPAAADLWFQNGFGTGSIVDYVHNVRGFAQEW